MSPVYKSVTTTEYSGNSSGHFPVYCPATGSVITNVAGSDVASTEQAINASHAAFKSWRTVPPLQRGIYLCKVADALEARADELAEILCLENGKSLQDGRANDLNFLIYIFRFFGGLIGRLPGEFYDRGSMTARVIQEPFGVTAGILPFNWPPIHTGGKIAPAIATGNTMIIKPGEQAPLTVMKIVEIIQTVLPKDVVIALPAKGFEVPQVLAKSPLVKVISFTGSTNGGIAIAQSAAANLKPTLLELGGKNAFIVFEDADVERAVKDALEGVFYNKGEACTAASRLIVHDSVHEEFVSKLSQAVKKLVVGDGMNPATHVGPVISKEAQKRVLSYIQRGQDDGGIIAAQASLPTDARLQNGYFVPPTLFTGITRDMTLANEEIFGPVATVTRFSTEEEAISIANSVDYGLTAIIFSRDHQRCGRVSRQVDAGMIWFNQYNRFGLLGTPFGGTKMSGHGREHCIETLREFTWAKTIHEPTGLGVLPNWRAVADCYQP